MSEPACADALQPSDPLAARPFEQSVKCRCLRFEKGTACPHIVPVRFENRSMPA